MADDRRRPCVSGHITLARLSTGGDSGSAKIRAACETPRRQRPRAGSSAGRLGRSRATVVLDRLTPAERIAFVLHDMFAVSFDEIASIIGRSPTAARQLASRARRRVQGADRVPASDLSEQREVVSAFLTALRAGDFEGLIAVLDPDVVVRADSTTVPPGPQTEIRGARTWAKGAIAFSQLVRSAPPMLVDGAVGLVWAPGGRLSRVLRFTITSGKIVQVEIIADPARLRDLDLAVIKE
jgi:ketosteroid isomerase-like protein